VLVGYGARHGADRSPGRTLLLFALASAVIYVIGTAWLCLDTGMSVRAGMSAGVTPFLPGDAAKALLAAGLLPATWRLVGRGPGREGGVSVLGQRKTSRAGDGQPDPHTTAGKIADLERRRHEAVHAGSAAAVEKQHAKSPASTTAAAPGSRKGSGA
jgi:hypothetical protein